MKIVKVVLARGAALVLAAGMFSQFNSALGAPASADSVVRIAAEAKGLPLVPADELPGNGTFWVVTADGSFFPPLPFLPDEPTNTPVFSLGSAGQFLVDATGGVVPQPTRLQALSGVTSATLLEAQGNAVLDLITRVQETLLNAKQAQAPEAMMALSLSSSTFSAQASQMRSLTPMYGAYGLLSLGCNCACTCATGGQVYFTNVSATLTTNAGMVVSFNVAGGTNGIVYGVFTTTNLGSAQWKWLGNTYTCSTVYLANQPGDVSFYALGAAPPTMVVPWGDDYFGQCTYGYPAGVTNIVSVAAAFWHSIGLKSDGTVLTWGYPYGAATYVPTNLTGGVTAVAAGWSHNLALLTNGTVIAWGDIPTNDMEWPATNVPANVTNIIVIAANSFHNLALRCDGTVVGWGYYTPNGETNVPTGLSNIVAIAAGPEHDLAVQSNGTVVAWGNNSFGQCNIPAGLTNVSDVAAGWWYSLALKKDGTVVVWGDNTFGQTNVPAGLSNVVALAAGGDPFDEDLYPAEETAYSLALKKDGTVAVWGNGPVTNLPVGMTGVFAIAGGYFHGVAIRSGPLTPVILQEPTDHYQLAGGSVTFTAQGLGIANISYQWQFNGVDISGATNASLTLTNVQDATEGSYQAVVSNGAGSVTSSAAMFIRVRPPQIISTTPAIPGTNWISSLFTLNVSATAADQSQYPISYEWLLDGTNSFFVSSNRVVSPIPNQEGSHSVIVSNAAGSTNVGIWFIRVMGQGMVAAWGDNSDGVCDRPVTLNDTLALAAGEVHSVAVRDNGTVVQWGHLWTNAPGDLTNAIAVAAGYSHTLALRSDGTVTSWGRNDFNQTNVPSNATNIIAVSAGGWQSLALKKDGTVVQWGQTNAPIPAGLANVTAIASGTNFHLALLNNTTVVAWGANDYSQTNVPANLSNVVAIAAGGSHVLALKQDGKVSAWGSLTNVPGALSNVMAVAAGYAHSVALKNDGTVAAWGDNTHDQTNVLTNMPLVKLIAAGGDHTLVGFFSPQVQYRVDVTKDLLLIYNSASTNSIAVKDYYLAHRPMVANANVLGVACEVGEFFYNSNNWDAQLVTPVLNWLTNNPTKHPQYVILFYDIPMRLWFPDEVGCGGYQPGDAAIYTGSVSYHLQQAFPGWKPLVNNINQGTVADCKAYIDKLASFGASNSPGQLLISASTHGYGNTNYVIDNARHGNGYLDNFTGSYSGSFVFSATNGLLASGVSPSAITYNDGLDTITTVITNGGTNYIFYNAPQITGATNIAGYICWGEHSALGQTYAIDGTVKWADNSGWWIIETIESFNGMRTPCAQGNFIQWFSSNAFGGTNYSNTPIGAISHTEEPGLASVENSATYFGLWAVGKNFAICAWNPYHTQFFQAVGDPFVTK